MLVKLVKLGENYLNDATVTVGKTYNTDMVDNWGDVKIVDDEGMTSFLFRGEFEVVEG